MLAIQIVLTVSIIMLIIGLYTCILSYKDKDIKLLKNSINFIKSILLTDLVYFMLVVIIGFMPVK